MQYTEAIRSRSSSFLTVRGVGIAPIGILLDGDAGEGCNPN
jgi:hypothetical protein